MENKSRYIIDNEGQFFREDIVVTPIEPGPGLIKALTTGMSVRINNLVNLPEFGVANLAVEETGVQHWTVPMDVIHFNTNFLAKEDEQGSELVPKFAGDTAANMVIPWVVAKAWAGVGSVMRVRFVATITKNSAGVYYVHKQYLLAYDEGGSAYRLPVSNLYDTCELCNGEYNSRSNTALEALQKSLTQFRLGSWNSDLFKDPDLVENFVRFRPLKEGFETLPTKQVWTKYCRKVSPPIFKYVIV